MTPTVIGLVLVAALMNASWNAALRGAEDRLWAVTVMSYATTAAALPCVLLFPLPDTASWPYAATSAVLQTGYGVFLAYAYRHGELGHVYPIARGGAPPMVAMASFLFAGQPLTPPLILGVALISGGVLISAFGRNRAPPKSIGLALVTALFVASYVTVDGIGVRRSGHPLSYAAWVFLLYGALAPFAYLALRRRFASNAFSREGIKALAGGFVSVLSYGTVLVALALAPIGPVAALRETSIVFSILIGHFALRERTTQKRILTCVAVTVGAVVISAAR